MSYFIRVFVIMIITILGFTEHAQAESPNFLYFPTDDSAVYVQQGWIYDYSTSNHCGIDYRKGTSGQWNTFEVTASHDGDYVCMESSTWGYYARGTYSTEDHTYYSIYAHLESCEFESGHFNAGEYLGMAGMTGSANGYLHLHYEIGVDNYGQSGCSENVDPYDLYTTQEVYPDIYNEEGSCGADNLWTQCPPVMADSCTTESSSYVVPVILAEDTIGQKFYHTRSSTTDAALTAIGTLTYDGAGTVKKWLVGNVNGDDYDDVIIAVNSDDNTTRSYVVRIADGDGTFSSSGTWLSLDRADADMTFLADTDADGLSDIIIGKQQTSGDWRWTIWTSTGSAFSNAATWAEDFGAWNDIFLVADLTGDGTADLLRGREADGSTQADPGNCNNGNQLIWKRLKADGTTSTVVTDSDLWGYSAAQYLTGNIDLNASDKDDIVQIQLCDDDVEAYVRYYDATSGELAAGVSDDHTTSKLASDVGGIDGQYAVADMNDDGYPDLMRWSNTGLIWLRNNNGTAFSEGSAADTLTTAIGYTSDTQQLLLGNFGDYTITAEICTTSVASTDTTTTSPTVNPYTSQVLTNLASVDYADLASSVSCSVDEPDSLYVVLNGQDGRIYEFESTDDGQTWTSTGLTNIAAVPLSAPGTSPHLFIDPTTSDRYVTFVGDNARINLFHYNGTSWSAVELTSVVAAPLADPTSSPVGYIANGIVYVVFQGDDQRIWWFTITNGSTYGSLDLTGRAAVAYAMPGTSPMGIYNEITGEHHIVFQGVNQRIQRLTFNGSTWSSVEITSVVNSDLLDPDSSPVTYVDPFTSYVYTVINGVNERIDLIADYHTSFDSDELTSLISVPLTEPGSSPTGYIDPITGHHIITFIGDDLRVYQFEGPPWTSIDLTSQASVELAADGSSPATCVDPITGVRHVVFIGGNGRVQYLRYGP